MKTIVLPKSSRFDSIDLRIVEALRIDGRMTITQLAEEVGLSKTPCQLRLRKLIECGCIRGFRAVVDFKMLGQAHIAFAEVKLSDTKEAALAAFRAGVSRVHEIEECHMIAGQFDYLLKVRTSDISAYRRVLGEKISSLPHVASTSTYVVMESVIDEGG